MKFFPDLQASDGKSCNHRSRKRSISAARRLKTRLRLTMTKERFYANPQGGDWANFWSKWSTRKSWCCCASRCDLKSLFRTLSFPKASAKNKQLIKVLKVLKSFEWIQQLNKTFLWRHGHHIGVQNNQNHGSRVGGAKLIPWNTF